MMAILALGTVACGGSSKPATTPTDPSAATTDDSAPATATGEATTPTQEMGTVDGDSAGGRSEAGWGTPGADAEPADEPAPVADAEQEQRCHLAIAHIIPLLRAGLEEMFAGMPPDQQAKAREELDQQLSEDALFTECIKRPFTPSQYDCVMAASTFQDLMACDKA